MAENPKTRAKSKAKHRLKFRFSIVFLSFLLSFMLCYIAYVKNVREKEAEIAPVINRNLDDAGREESNPFEDNVVEEEVTSETSFVPVVPEGTEEKVVNPVPQSEKKDQSYLEECVFVGDSISTGFSGYGFVSEKNVFAKTSMRIDLINSTPLDTFYGNILAVNAIKAAKAQNVYVMLGSNGMGWINNVAMIDDYGVFISNIKSVVPDAKIYLISVPPVTAEREQIATVEEGQILNSTINEYNTMLLELANDNNVYYLDVHSVLVNQNGMLPSEESTDGMHFTKKTYEKVIDYILSHVVE